METCEIVYRMSSDAGVDGVEVHEVADVMYAFAETVQAALDEAGEEGQLSIHVRPFRQGSFVTEFVLSYGQGIASLFSSPEGTALTGVLTTLGFLGFSAKSVPNVVRKVRGRIDKNRDNGDGTYTYGDGDGSVTVDEATHRIIQSPKVAKPYKTVTIGPIVKIDKSISVTIQGRDEFAEGRKAAGSRFDGDDVPDMEAYAHVAVEGVPEESEDILSVSHDVVLAPKSGPYDGGKSGYTFKCGEQVFPRVQMLDLDFRLKLERGEVRLMDKDLLVVDMETTQTVTRKGVKVARAITRVKTYRPYSPPEQLAMGEPAESPPGP